MPTSRSRAPHEVMRSGRRKPSPISTISPRLTTTSPPAARAVVASTRAAAPLLTTSASSASGHRSRRASTGPRPRPAPPPGREVELDVDRTGGDVQRLDGGAESGARPRLVCSTTPVALSTGVRVVAPSGEGGEHRVDDVGRGEVGRRGPGPGRRTRLGARHPHPPCRRRHAGAGRRARRRCAARTGAGPAAARRRTRGPPSYAGGGGRESNPPSRGARLHRC